MRLHLALVLRKMKMKRTETGVVEAETGRELGGLYGGSCR